VIPQVAARLNELQESADKGKTHLDLIEVLHSVLNQPTVLRIPHSAHILLCAYLDHCQAGVNVRHLGKIRQLVNPKLQQTTLIEACLPLLCLCACACAVAD
jgi:hypothetical protein